MAFISIDSIVRRDTSLFRCLFTAFLLFIPLAASAQPLLISEYRVRGPNGANDEFVEIYNNSGANHTVAAVSGTGYGLAASDGVTRCSIPNGTVIPSRGFYLCVNSVGYSLASYPAGNGTTATGDATYTTDIPDNAGIALFNNNTGGGSYVLANRLDAVGSTSEANTLYKEGTGYPALTPFSIDYAFTRRLPGGCTGSAGSVSGNCTTLALIQTTPGPSSTQVQDTNNNANDFIFVDTNGTSAGAGQRLGAPGPENQSAPIARDGVALLTTKFDTCEPLRGPPNLVRDFTSDPANNSTFGTLEVRRTFTNTTGVPITRLRLRIVDITTFPSISGVADFRPRTSGDVVVTVDRAPCGTGTSNVTARGTTLEQPPSQPNGSGFNGSLSVGAVTLGTPIAAGASMDVRFLLGIQQTGAGRFCVATETVPALSSQVFCYIGSADGGGTSGVTTSDFDGNGATDRAVYRPSTGAWHVQGWASVQWGIPGDVPVAGDYDGDGTTDVAVYRPSNGFWFVRNQGQVQWGIPGDIPVPGDYNGAGTTERAVYRPSTGTWFVQTRTPVQWGVPGDVPVPGDYNGDGTTEVAVYRPSTGVWFVSTLASVAWGAPGDVPVPGDYNGDGTTDIAVYRPSNGFWFVRNQGQVQWGIPGDIPVPGDYDGDLATDRAVYRSSTGTWFVEGLAAVVWGTPGDLPIPRPEVLGDVNSDGTMDLGGELGDFNGNGTTDIAVYRESAGIWYAQSQAATAWGVPGDIPVPGDYNGNGTTERAVYRPSTGTWYVQGGVTVQWGVPGDIPVPGDYNGNGTTDIAVYRPSTGFWFVQGQAGVTWGAAGDIPVPGDYNGDGTTDIAVYRPSLGFWFVQSQATVAWGLPGDIAVPGDYNGGGTTDRAVYTPSTGSWWVHGQAAVAWGAPGDIPVPGDYNGNGTTERAVYRPSTGTWFVQGQAPVQWGVAGDIPASRAYVPR